MATQRQIDANRENALKSTGPRTEAGKAASSANALSHGLTAASTVVLPEEDTDAFERLREGVIADLDPAGALQKALAQRVAVLLWRLDRATRLEAELFVHGQLAMLRSRADQALDPGARLRRLAELPGESTEAREKIKQFRDQIDVDMCAQAPFAQILVERVESARTYDLLARHEATLQRALNRTLDEFRRLRDAASAAARPNAAPPATPPIPTRLQSQQPIPTRRHPTLPARPCRRARARPPPGSMPGPGTTAKKRFCKTKPIPNKLLKRRTIQTPERIRRWLRPSPDAPFPGPDPSARRLRRVLRRHSFGAAASQPAA